MYPNGLPGGGAGAQPQTTDSAATNQVIRQQQLYRATQFSAAPQQQWPMGGFIPMSISNNMMMGFNPLVMQQLQLQQQMLQQQMMASKTSLHSSLPAGAYPFGMMLPGAYMPQEQTSPAYHDTTGSVISTPNVQGFQGGYARSDIARDSAYERASAPLFSRTSSQLPVPSQPAVSKTPEQLCTSSSVKESVETSLNDEAEQMFQAKVLPSAPIRTFKTKGLRPGEEERWISGISIKQLVQEFQVIGKPTQQHSVPPQFASLAASTTPSQSPTGISRTCGVCLEPQRPAALCLLGDIMVQCCDCNLLVHRRCYGIHRVLDSGGTVQRPAFPKFLCDICRTIRQNVADAQSGSLDCFICGKDGGPRKRVLNGKQGWVHVYCALLTPEAVSIRDIKNMSAFYETATNRLKREQKLAQQEKVNDVRLDKGESAADSNQSSLPDDSAVSTSDNSITQIPESSNAITVTSFPPEEDKCLVCNDSSGYFLKCCASDCAAVMHALCMRQYIRDCELEGRNQVSTCLEICPNAPQSNHHVSTSPAVLVMGTVKQSPSLPSVRAFCPQHCPMPQYCSCAGVLEPQSEAAAMMVGCDVCGDWLHSGCIGAMAAESALQADNYQCGRCLKQRAQMALLDRTWAVLPFDEDIAKATTQSRDLLGSLLAASLANQQTANCGTNIIPAVFDIGNVIPSHRRGAGGEEPYRLHARDFCLINLHYRVEVVLLADKIIFSSSSPSLKQLLTTNLEGSNEEREHFLAHNVPPAEFDAGCINTAKKKLQLKKKATNEAQSDCSSTSGTSAAAYAVLHRKAKRPLTPSVMHKTSEQLLRPALTTKKPSPEILGNRKTALSKRLISKLPSESAVSTKSTIAKPSSVLTKKIVARQPGLVANTSKGVIPVRPKVAVATAKPKRPSEFASKKQASEPARLTDDVWPLSGIVNLSSVKALSVKAAQVPFSVKFWEKELTGLLTRCEMWIVEMTKAIQANNNESLQICLKSHSHAFLSRLLAATKSEASIKADHKVDLKTEQKDTKSENRSDNSESLRSEVKPAALNVPRITRVSVALCPKSALSYLLYYVSSGPGFVGGLSVLTVEAVTLRIQARVTLFLAMNETLLTTPISEIPMAKVNQTIKEISTVPHLACLKSHLLYSTAKKIQDRIRACTALSQTLRAAPKPDIAEIQSLLDEVATKLPPDCGVDLYSLPDLLTRGRQLQAQIDWSSLRSMRNVLSQTQHLPLSSEVFVRLQDVVAKVDVWRREYRRFVSLMTVGSNATAGSAEGNAHRRNVVVSGQSGFLKDLFTGGSNGVAAVVPETADSQVFTQNQSLEEAKQLLERGEEMAVACEEIVRLRRYVDTCIEWAAAVSQALSLEELSSSADTVTRVTSWSTLELIDLQRRKSLLPFAPPAELAIKLDKRIEFLLQAEGDIINRVLGRVVSVNISESPSIDLRQSGMFIPTTVEVSELIRRTLLFQQGAVESIERSRVFRSLGACLTTRLEIYETWRSAVEQTLLTADKILETYTDRNYSRDSRMIMPHKLSADLKCPPRPFISQEISKPVIDAALLMHLWSYTEDEIQKLSDTVIQSVHWANTPKDLLCEGQGLIEDEFDEDLFDDISQECPPCPKLLTTYSQRFDSLSADAKVEDVREIFLIHAILLITHFLVLCPPEILIQHPLYKLLQIIIIPLFLALNLAGSAICATLLPADSPLLRRLVRGNAPTVTNRGPKREGEDVQSQSWALAEFSWQYFFIESDNQFLTRCILKLLVFFFLVVDVKKGKATIQRLISLAAAGAEVSQDASFSCNGAELECADEQSLLLDFSSPEVASYHLAVVSILRSLREQCRKDFEPGDENGPFAPLSIESQLQCLLDKSTWLFRAQRTLQSLDGQAFSFVPLVNLSELIEEFVEFPLDNKSEVGNLHLNTFNNGSNTGSEIEAQHRLKQHLKSAMDWFDSVRIELMQETEARIFVPQILQPWDNMILPLVGTLRPAHVLAALSQSTTNQVMSFIAGSDCIGEAKIFDVLLQSSEWDQTSWRSVLQSFQQEWQQLNHYNAQGLWSAAMCGPRHVLSQSSLPTGLSEMQRVVTLHAVGDLAVGTRWVDLGMPSGVLERISEFYSDPDTVSLNPSTLPPDEAAQVFHEAVSSMAANSAESHTQDILANLVDITSLRKTLQNIYKASPKTSLLAPAYFKSDLISKIKQILSVPSASVPSIKISTTPPLLVQWQRALLTCVTQGWAVAQVSTIPGLEGQMGEISQVFEPGRPPLTGEPNVMMTNEVMLFEQASATEVFITRQYAIAAGLLRRTLLEMSQARRCRLVKLMQQRPTRVCASDEPLCRLLDLHLNLCDWNIAAIQVLQDPSGVDSIQLETYTHVPKTLQLPVLATAPAEVDLSGKSQFEQLSQLTATLASLRKRIDAVAKIIISDESASQASHRQPDVLYPILWSMGISVSSKESSMDNSMVGGFLAFELHHRLEALKKLLDTTALAPSWSTAVLMNRVHTHVKLSCLLPQNQDEVANACKLLSKELQLRFLGESLALRTFELLFLHFASGLTQHKASYAQLVTLLPPLLFENPTLIPVVRELGLLHVAEDFELLVADIHYMTEIESSKQFTTMGLNEIPASSRNQGDPFSTADALIEPLPDTLELPSFPTDDDRSEVAKKLPASQQFFFHPRLLMTLVSVLDLQEIRDAPLRSLGTSALDLASTLAEFAFIQGHSLEIQSEAVADKTLNAILEEIFDKVIAEESAQRFVPQMLLESLKVLRWRFCVKPHLMPRVMPYDTLEIELVKLQSTQAAWSARAAGSSLSFFDEAQLSQLLGNECQLLEPFEAKLQSFPPSVSVVWVCATFLAAYLLKSACSQIAIQAACCMGSQDGIIRAEEQLELTRRYENTTAVMLSFVQYQRDLSCGKPLTSSRGVSGTYITIETLAATAGRILHEQRIAHPAVESLYAYLEEVAVWELTAQHVLERLQARQEKQHELLRRAESLKQDEKVTNDQVQAIWDAYGMSEALTCKPTLPTNCHLSFSKSIPSHESLQLLHTRGGLLSCVIRGQQLEALFGQLEEVTCALGILNTQAEGLLKLARDIIALPESSLYSKPANLLDRAQLEQLLQQSLFAELPTHPQLRDLLKRCVEFEYLTSALFEWNEQSKNRMIRLEFPPAENIKSFETYFMETPAKDEATGGNLTVVPSSSGDCVALSSTERSTEITSKPVNAEVSPLPSGLITQTQLIQLVYDRCSLSWCPVALDMRSDAERACWIRTVRQMFMTGDPLNSGRVINFPANPSLKMTQALLSQGRAIFENLAAPQELTVLRSLLAASKQLLTEARSTPEKWIRIRFLQHCYPIYLAEEMRSLRTKLQHKYPNIFIDIITQGNEIHIKNRFVPSVKFPHKDEISVPALKGSAITSILSYAIKEEANNVERDKSSDVGSPNTLLGQSASPDAVSDAVRSSVRACIEVLFDDGGAAAAEREETLYSVVGRAISEEYFKGLLTVVIKRLQQSVVARRPITNSISKPLESVSSLETLLSAPTSASTTVAEALPKNFTTSKSKAAEMSSLNIVQPTTETSTLSPLQAAGIIWHGSLVGQLSTPDLPPGAIHLPLWVTPLFTPVPSEIYTQLSNIGQMTLSCEMTVPDFGRYLLSASTQLLNVVFGATWHNESLECRRIVRLLRPPQLQIVAEKSRSQLLAVEAEALQRKALEETVKVLLFTPKTPDNSVSSMRLWMIPPASSVTESFLPTAVPKSNQLIFGVLELNMTTPLSTETRNISFGEIRAVATSVCRALQTLQETRPSSISPESIPPFSNLRVSLPATSFQYVLPPAAETTPPPEHSMVVTESEVILDAETAVLPARIPKRARHTEEGAKVSKVPPWQQQMSSQAKPMATTLVALLQQQQQEARRAAQDPYNQTTADASDSCQKKNEAPNPCLAQVPMDTASPRPKAPWHAQQNAFSVKPPVSSQCAALPFAMPEALRSLFKGAAAELRSKRLQ